MVKNGWLIFAHVIGLVVLNVIALFAVIIFAIARACLKGKVTAVLQKPVVIEEVISFKVEQWDGLKKLSEENLQEVEERVMMETSKELPPLIEKLKKSYYFEKVLKANFFTAHSGDFKVLTEKARGISVKKVGELVVFDDKGGKKRLAIISSYSRSKFGQIESAKISFYRDLNDSTPMISICKTLDQLYDPTQEVKTAFEKSKRCDYTDKLSGILQGYRNKRSSVSFK